jgi:hypothetical protein
MLFTVTSTVVRLSTARSIAPLSIWSSAKLHSADAMRILVRRASARSRWPTGEVWLITFSVEAMPCIGQTTALTDSFEAVRKTPNVSKKRRRSPLYGKEFGAQEPCGSTSHCARSGSRAYPVRHDPAFSLFSYAAEGQSFGAGQVWSRIP